jgi:hypothetical protein
MAVAVQTGVTALGMVWWETSYAGAGDAFRRKAVSEILRQGAFLASAWDGQQLLIGVGDGINKTDNSLLTYGDFGTAPNALLIGKDDAFGQPTMV